MLLKHRSVVVTGSSRGIGAGIARACAQAGAKLVLAHEGSAKSEDEVEELAREVSREFGTECVAVGGDISDQETSRRIVAAAIKAYGRIDGLVSNAGICTFRSFFEITPELWDRHRRVNVDGTWFICQAVAEQMKNQGTGGSIVAISSISALVGGGEQVAYTPTKAAVKSLMESSAVALGPYGIRCNSLLPGTIRTAINEEDLSNDAKRTAMEARVPCGRLGQPSDLGGPAVFLLSDMSSYVNGANLLVDGGLFVNLQ